MCVYTRNCTTQTPHHTAQAHHLTPTGRVLGKGLSMNIPPSPSSPDISMLSMLCASKSDDQIYEVISNCTGA